jgi:hypothetical protein
MTAHTLQKTYPTAAHIDRQLCVTIKFTPGANLFRFRVSESSDDGETGRYYSVFATLGEAVDDANERCKAMRYETIQGALQRILTGKGTSMDARVVLDEQNRTA